jgi:hypothetical protein
MLLDQNLYRRAHADLRQGIHELEADTLSALGSFDSHNLAEQRAVDLPNRTDSKYLFPVKLLPRFLAEVCADHTVLQTDQHRIFTYENTYFDTNDWATYNAHHNGKLNRYKYRFRRYLETDMSYLEFKLKNNRNRTVKTRTRWHSEKPIEVMQDKVAVEPSLYVNYRRISLWNRATDERLTLDFDLRWCRPGQDNEVCLQHLFIAELKRDGKVSGSPFLRVAKNYGYRPNAMSKYCIGLCLTDDGALKQNRFKPLLAKLSGAIVKSTKNQSTMGTQTP